jgi:hypothetical protein
VHTPGDIAKCLLDLSAPAHSLAQASGVTDQERRRQSALAGPGQQRDHVVKTGRDLSEVENRPLDGRLQWQPPLPANRDAPPRPVNHQTRDAPHMLPCRDRDVK